MHLDDGSEDPCDDERDTVVTPLRRQQGEVIEFINIQGELVEIQGTGQLYINGELKEQNMTSFDISVEEHSYNISSGWRGTFRDDIPSVRSSPPSPSERPPVSAGFVRPSPSALSARFRPLRPSVK